MIALVFSPGRPPSILSSSPNPALTPTISLQCHLLCISLAFYVETFHPFCYDYYIASSIIIQVILQFQTHRLKDFSSTLTIYGNRYLEVGVGGSSVVNGTAPICTPYHPYNPYYLPIFPSLTLSIVWPPVPPIGYWYYIEVITIYESSGRQHFESPYNNAYVCGG